jgi:protein TonB
MKNELLLDPLMNEMVFEHRNKMYGAYQLRALYDKRMAVGLLISITFIVSLFFGMSAYTKWRAGHSLTTDIVETYTVVELDQFRKEIKPRVLIKPAVQATAVRSKKEVTATRVVKDDADKNEQKEPDVTTVSTPVPGIPDTIIGAHDPVLPPDGNYPVPPPNETDPGDAITPLHMYQVEQKPVFPGGEEAMYKYLREQLQYPLTARENKITGRVVVQFIVNENGRTENIVIVQSASSLFNPGSIAVIEQMPPWTPGKNNGKPVSVVFTLPLTYKLL